MALTLKRQIPLLNLMAAANGSIEGNGQPDLLPGPNSLRRPPH
jgi:hypothetical protein